MIRPKTTTEKEPTIALINVVFLMLIFFMIAGTLSPPLDKDLALISTAALDGREPPDTLVIHADARMTLRGEPVESAETFIAGLRADTLGDGVRIVPDRGLPATELVRIGRDLRRAGAERVLIVTERALE